VVLGVPLIALVLRLGKGE